MISQWQVTQSTHCHAFLPVQKKGCNWTRCLVLGELSGLLIIFHFAWTAQHWGCCLSLFPFLQKCTCGLHWEKSGLVTNFILIYMCYIHTYKIYKLITNKFYVIIHKCLWYGLSLLGKWYKAEINCQGKIQLPNCMTEKNPPLSSQCFVTWQTFPNHTSSDI